MIGTIATLVGYRKAPKATYVLKHPIKGTAAFMAAKKISPSTAVGIGAAVVAVPLGLWYALR
jgi:hypothetical protein